MPTLSQVLRHTESDEPALIGLEQGISTISHRQLKLQVNEVRDWLTQCRVAPGSIIAISLPNSLGLAVLFLSICMNRGIAAPLNPAYKQDEVEFYTADVGAAAVVVPKNTFERENAAVLAAKKLNIAIIECSCDGKTVSLDLKSEGGLRHHAGGLPIEPCEDDVALILHTSGTTGRPKAVPLSHKNLSVSIENICHTYRLTSNDSTMLIMPLFHIHGIVAAFLAPLSAGSSVIIPPRLLPSFWQDFETHWATWYTATPTMHQILLSFPPPEKMPYIRFIRSCSSPLAQKTKAKLESQFGAPVLEAYAMTEASHQISSNSLPPVPCPIGSCGMIQGNIEIKIVDVNCTPVAPGAEGEISIRGPTVMGGYLSNAEANASTFTCDGFFLTGDYGKQDDNGFLTLTGRIKEFINKGGEKISPVELDEVVLGHPLIADAVSCAIDDEMYGQDIGVAVRLNDGVAITARDLRKWMRERVAPQKVPKKIWITSEIPKTATGKVQRKLVAEKILERVQMDKEMNT